jgi:2-haloacid dehalogenase
MSEFRLGAFVFDAYGTLFDVHSVIERCERHFPRRGTELSRLWRTKQLEYSWLRSLMGCHGDFWQLTGDALAFACRSLGLACPEVIREDLMAAYLRLETFPEVKGALADLKGVPLAILSNGTPEMLRAVVEHQSLGDAFTAAISVEEAGIFKPHPSVYALAPKRLGFRRKPSVSCPPTAGTWPGLRTSGSRPSRSIGRGIRLRICPDGPSRYSGAWTSSGPGFAEPGRGRPESGGVTRAEVLDAERRVHRLAFAPACREEVVPLSLTGEAEKVRGAQEGGKSQNGRTVSGGMATTATSRRLERAHQRLPSGQNARLRPRFLRAAAQQFPLRPYRP